MSMKDDFTALVNEAQTEINKVLDDLNTQKISPSRAAAVLVAFTKAIESMRIARTAYQAPGLITGRDMPKQTPVPGQVLVTSKTGARIAPADEHIGPAAKKRTFVSPRPYQPQGAKATPAKTGTYVPYKTGVPVTHGAPDPRYQPHGNPNPKASPVLGPEVHNTTADPRSHSKK